MKKIKINFVGLYNFINNGSYRHFFEDGINLILADSRVGKTTLAKIPFYTLGCNTDLETISEEYDDFMTILSLNIDNENYYFLRLNNKKYENQLYILNNSYQILWEGKTYSRNNTKSVLGYADYIYNLFGLENFLIKNTIKNKISFSTPYPGAMFELFYIDQLNWGADWKTFKKELFNISPKDYSYIYAYLYGIISDDDIKFLNDNASIASSIIDDELTKDKLEFIIKELSKKFSSDQDFKEIKDISNNSKKLFSNMIIKEKEIKGNMLNERKISEKIAELEIQFNLLNANINAINEFIEQNSDFIYNVDINGANHKIYLKDILDFRAKTVLNLQEKEKILDEINILKTNKKLINTTIKSLKTEYFNLKLELKKFDSLLAQVGNKEENNRIKILIQNYENNLNDLNKKIKKAKKEKKAFDQKSIFITLELNKLNQKLLNDIKIYISKLDLKYSVKIKDAIYNKKKYTGSESIIYSLTRLFINYKNIVKLNSFFIIDSPKKEEQDLPTIRARNLIFRDIIDYNKIFNRQFLIFSVNKNDLDFDNIKNISESTIDRSPQKLLEIQDSYFNEWLSTNILDKIK
ncbi:hypothetical protein SSYRP_v1c07760 [Spiroplasma syrphidicola EA-1]|uniref:Uncharacterized protein n=1 Tax=Spiroplasma syrphidicola EA-1 TaxID=1276229 RepID=R4UMA5_9MOLU|nr:hypothetical protein [Spiroplasma syrphidicola]AGM26366.1 hypothetical protein SSYRP_v1c07760 [Spiroplasma syrphidicola EA-1]